MQYRVVAAVVLVVGCTNPDTDAIGSGADSGVGIDAGNPPGDDASAPDAGQAHADAGQVDAGQADAGQADADAGQADDCSPGATRCSGPRDLERCDANSTWQRVGQCSAICLNDVCTGECGPGATACCTSLPDGTDVGCSIDPITQVCTAGTSCAEPRVAFVRKCNELGQWVRVSPACPECLIAANGFVNYAMCRICDVPGVGTEARCDSTDDCLNGCGE